MQVVLDREIKDILVSIQAIDKKGNVLTIPAKKINFDYIEIMIYQMI